MLYVTKKKSQQLGYKESQREEEAYFKNGMSYYSADLPCMVNILCAGVETMHCPPPYRGLFGKLEVCKVEEIAVCS